MRRQPDRRIDLPRKRSPRDRQCARPRTGRGLAVERPIAGEGELAAGAPLLPLKHHAAHRLGEGGMAHAIKHDLRHRLLACGIVARLVDLRRRQAIDRPRQIVRRSGKDERPCGGIGQFGKRHRRIEPPRLVPFQRIDLHRLDRRRRAGRLLDARDAAAHRSRAMRHVTAAHLPSGHRHWQPDQDQRPGDPCEGRGGVGARGHAGRLIPAGNRARTDSARPYHS